MDVVDDLVAVFRREHFDLALESLFVQLHAFRHAVLPTLWPEAPDVFESEAVCHIDGLTTFHFELPSSWSSSVSCEGTDWWILLLLFLVIHTISWVGRWIFWQPLARIIAKCRSHAIDAISVERFGLSMTECSFFVLSGFFAFRIISKKPWLYHPLEWNSNLYDDSNYLWLDTDFKFYYLLYLARFISATISVVPERHLRRWDVTLTNVVHHVITLGLVFGSAVHGLTRMGGVIMVFFDWTDPPLLTAKSLKYLSRHESDIFQRLANALFIVFALIFILTRNVLYNFVVYVGVRDLPDWAVTSKVLLVALALLQTYWFYLLLQVVVKQIQSGGVVSDVREDNTKQKKS